MRARPRAWQVLLSVIAATSLLIVTAMPANAATKTGCIEDYGCTTVTLNSGVIYGVQVVYGSVSATYYSSGSSLWVQFNMYNAAWQVVESEQRFCGGSRPCVVTPTIQAGTGWTLCGWSWKAGDNRQPTECVTV